MRRHGVSYIAGFNNQMTSRADSCHITRVIFPLKKFCCVVGAWHLLLVGVAINLNLFELVQSEVYGYLLLNWILKGFSLA